MKFMFYLVPHAVIFSRPLASTKTHAGWMLSSENKLLGQSTEQNQLNKLLPRVFHLTVLCRGSEFGIQHTWLLSIFLLL